MMCLHKDPGDNISTISAANNGLYHYRLQFSSTQENIGMVSEGMGQVMLGHRVPVISVENSAVKCPIWSTTGFHNHGESSY